MDLVAPIPVQELYQSFHVSHDLQETSIVHTQIEHVYIDVKVTAEQFVKNQRNFPDSAHIGLPWYNKRTNETKICISFHKYFQSIFKSVTFLDA